MKWIFKCHAWRREVSLSSATARRGTILYGAASRRLKCPSF